MAAGTDSVTVQVWIDRLREGDDSAREALLSRAFDRLRRLARKILKGYPVVGRWEQTDDVLQNAMIRLDRALRYLDPPTAKDFFRLAAAQIRRELIDLARHYEGPKGLGANHESRQGPDSRIGFGRSTEASQDHERLAEWSEFHEKVEALTDQDREMFDLLWYQGMSQAEAAASLGVSERTVNRRWLSARLHLCDAVMASFLNEMNCHSIAEERRCRP